VVVLEEVGRLVHQRRVTPARQHEALPATMVPAANYSPVESELMMFVSILTTKVCAG
jgi:hypothetical protein